MVLAALCEIFGLIAWVVIIAVLITLSFAVEKMIS